MPDTFIKIQSVSIGAEGSSEINFNNIPQIYSDLKIIISSRRSPGNVWGTYLLNFNADFGHSYSYKEIKGDGASSSAAGDIFTNTIKVAEGVGSGSGANIFDNTEIDIPAYCSNYNYKQINSLSAGENNNTTAYQGLWVGRWLSYDPVTSVSIIPGSGNFVQYTTATLYGIFNSNTSSAPNTPTIGAATAFAEEASIAFTETSNSSSYIITSSPGSITGTGTSSPIILKGLTNGTPYTFNIKSKNPFGESVQSSSTNSVTPTKSGFVSLSTVITSSITGTITFNNIPSGYTNLQVRGIVRNSISGYAGAQTFNWYFNNDNSSIYSWHQNAATNDTSPQMQALGAASSTNMNLGQWINPSDGAISGLYGSFILDIFDYSNTNSFKSLYLFGGCNQGGSSGNQNTGVGMVMGSYKSNSAISRIDIITGGGSSFVAGCMFSLYGIKES